MLPHCLQLFGKPGGVICYNDEAKELQTRGLFMFIFTPSLFSRIRSSRLAVLHACRGACCVMSLCLLVLHVGMPQTAHAQDDGRHALSLDVAQTVLGISGYVRWPVEHAHLKICLAGNVYYADALKNGARDIYRVRTQLPPFSDPVSFDDCHLVYVGAMADADLRMLFSRINGHPILSVSEPTVGCAATTMFCLELRGEKVGFEANLDAIARSGLRVHPHVLKLGSRKAGRI